MKRYLIPGLALIVGACLVTPRAEAQPVVASQLSKAQQKKLKANGVAKAAKAAKDALKAKKAARVAFAEATAARAKSKATPGSQQFVDLVAQEAAASDAVSDAVQARQRMKAALAARREESMSNYLARKDVEFAQDWQRQQDNARAQARRQRAAAAALAAALPSPPQDQAATPAPVAVAARGARVLPRQPVRAPLNYGRLAPEGGAGGGALPYTGQLPPPPVQYGVLPPNTPRAGARPQYDQVPAEQAADATTVQYDVLPKMRPVPAQNLQQFGGVERGLRDAITRAEQAAAPNR